jgi:hypothetical protein
MPVIPATQEVEYKDWEFKASSAIVSNKRIG